MKKRGLSIRYKFLLLLTGLPLMVLSAYLFLALNIFENDKIAYVFDSSSNVSATMASQIKTQLNSVLNSAKPVMQDYLMSNKFNNLSQTIFENDKDLDALVVFQKNPETGKYNIAIQLEKETALVSDLMEKIGPQISAYLVKVETEKRLVRVPLKDDMVLIFEKVSDVNSGRENVFMLAVRMSETYENFKSESAQKLYLISGDGQILFGPEQNQGELLQKYFSISLLSNAGLRSIQGAETSKTEDGTEFLISFSKAGFADLYVISSVAKDKALGAVKILIRKSLIFFVILICLTAIISLFASSKLTSALTSLFDATKKVSNGDFNIRVKVNSSDEVGSLAENFNIMASEVSRLLDQTAEKARMESELQTAKTVQETLFPDSYAQLGPLNIAGFYEPASECGGDWWHYSQSGGKIFLWIGDATGHGAPAALITSAAKSAASIIERLDVNPAQAMELLNKSIYDVSKGRIMMTFFIAALDPDTGILSYCNASHEPPILIRKKDGELKKKDLISLNDVNNPRLGQGRDSVYEQTEVQLNTEDSVFFYTDGIPDIQNRKKIAWGEREFLKKLILTNKDYPEVEEAVGNFVDHFQDHRQGASLIDDVTFFMVKYRVNT